MTKSIAEILGKRGCVVVGCEIPAHPRNIPMVLISGNVVEAVELVDVPDEEE